MKLLRSVFRGFLLYSARDAEYRQLAVKLKKTDSLKTVCLNINSPNAEVL